jgi:hypothetical protein
MCDAFIISPSTCVEAGPIHDLVPSYLYISSAYGYNSCVGRHCPKQIEHRYM